jgi:hypothetical protein
LASCTLALGIATAANAEESPAAKRKKAAEATRKALITEVASEARDKKATRDYQRERRQLGKQQLIGGAAEEARALRVKRDLKPVAAGEPGKPLELPPCGSVGVVAGEPCREFKPVAGETAPPKGFVRRMVDKIKGAVKKGDK